MMHKLGYLVEQRSIGFRYCPVVFLSVEGPAYFGSTLGRVMRQIVSEIRQVHVKNNILFVCFRQTVIKQAIQFHPRHLLKLTAEINRNPAQGIRETRNNSRPETRDPKPNTTRDPIPLPTSPASSSCHQPPSIFLLPTANYLLPTAYYLLPTAYCLLPTAN